MKKNSFFKRFIGLAMACIMVFGMSVSAFAAETSEEVKSKNDVSTSNFTDVAPLDNTQAIILDFIPSGSSKSDTGYLDHYVGLSKTFKCYLTTYGNTSGDVTVILYKPNGDIATSFKLNSGNTSYSKKFTLPSSGNWKMSAYNGTNNKVTVTGLWN